MRIININGKSVVEEAVKCLKSGGILIYPTETCYGVGVDAMNKTAVTKVLKYKKRPEGKSISIALPDIKTAEAYVKLNEAAKKIYKAFLPGPVTVVSESKSKVDSRLESEKQTLGIRIPDYEITLEILRKFGGPITSTSANSSGKKTPYSVSDILDNLTQKQKSLIDLIIDAGDLPHNPPSTVIDTTTQELTIYRKGQVEISQESKISKKKAKVRSEGASQTIKIAESFTKKIISGGTSPIVILLDGDLGAGKTQFVKGIAKALGVKETIKSPTYTYVSEYEIASPHNATPRAKLYHFDAWRIQNLEDIDALNFDNWFEVGNVIAIEWPSVILNLKKNFFRNLKATLIEIEEKGGNRRVIKVHENF